MPWTKAYFDEPDVEHTLAEQGLRALSFRDAIREALSQALETDPRVFVLGQGVDDPGGIFGTTLGLKEQFGAGRVMDIPIAENGLTGVAIGAAVAGMRPVFVHMRMDFLPMCMDQIVNHAAKWRYMTGGQVSVPLVIRSIVGRGWGSAAQHSQALHGLFLHVPGLKVVVPSTAYDAKGLLLAAIEDPDPVLTVEHRWIYGAKGYVPAERYVVRMGEALVRRPGTDVTIVAVSHMVYEALKAAAVLEKEGVSAEVVDPRTLRPLDMGTIIDSVGRTGRLVIADLGTRIGGCGAEIACRVAEAGAHLLKAPVRRVAWPEAPTPCSPVLEEAYYPDANTIADAVREIVRE